MQGRQGQGSEQWSNSPDQRGFSPNGTGRLRPTAFEGTGRHRTVNLDGTGEHRAIPQRPPNMPHLDTPPSIPRVARPKRDEVPPKNARRRLLILGGALLICALVTFFVTLQLSRGLSASSGPAGTANDFFNALSHQSYDQAYRDLGPAITLHISPDQFKQQAQTADRCYGAIQSYPEVANSATTQDDGSQSYTYTISRSKLPKSYTLRLTLQQDQEGNNWRISDYGTSLAPAQPASCK